MNKDELLGVARECGINFTPAGPGDDGIDTWYGNQFLPNGSLERFAAAMYAKGAADMKETAKAACSSLEDDYLTGKQFSGVVMTEAAAACGACANVVSALPITTNTEGEQS